MINAGDWESKFSKNFLQKIATAVSGGIEVVGASYNVVAYLGQQTVNGINHAVLAEQTVLNGKDSKNAAVLVFNEKPNSNDVSLIDIRRIVESGGELGGVKVDISFDIPAEVIEATNSALEGWVGADVNFVAYLGQQVKNGIDYILLAELVSIGPEDYTELVILVANDHNKSVRFDKLFEDSDDNQTASSFYVCNGKKFGVPLGEWP